MPAWEVDMLLDAVLQRTAAAPDASSSAARDASHLEAPTTGDPFAAPPSSLSEL